MGTQSAQRSQAMYREEEKLCLKWNDFQENAISAFGTLREDREFADVTLACEDGQQVEAHKVILASSSPFFLNLLKKNKHPHPLIFMRGLKSEDLVAIVDFLYFGEANVYQEKLDSFLAVAEELQVKGLMGSGAETEIEEAYMKFMPKKKTAKPVKNLNIPKNEFSNTDKQTSDMNELEPTPPREGTVAVTDYTVAADLQDLDDTIKSLMEVSENRCRGGKERARVCKVCGKEGQWNVIKEHIEAHHITGVSHACNICGKIHKTKATLRKHKRLHHKE